MDTLFTLKKKLFTTAWPIIALIAMMGWVGCSGAERPAQLGSPDTVQTQLDALNQTPGTFSLLEAAKIRYSQSTFSIYGMTDRGTLYKVDDNIRWLKDHPSHELPWGGPIRVFRKQAFMDKWGPLTENGFTGDPKNLHNGEIYTLDHRRLVAYRRAGRKIIRVQWADLSIVRENRWKFTTANGGSSIAPKP